MTTAAPSTALSPPRHLGIRSRVELAAAALTDGQVTR